MADFAIYEYSADVIRSHNFAPTNELLEVETHGQLENLQDPDGIQTHVILHTALIL